MIIHKPILVVWQESNQFIWNEIFFETLTNYNPGHDILRLFDVWQNFLVTTSEKKIISSNNHGIYGLPHELPSAQTSSQN